MKNNHRRVNVTGLILALVIILAAVLLINDFVSNKQRPIENLTPEAGKKAFQVMTKEFYEKTSIQVDRVYFSVMVTHELRGAETVQILGKNQKVYNVTMDKNGNIQHLHVSSWS